MGRTVRERALSDSARVGDACVSGGAFFVFVKKRPKRYMYLPVARRRVESRLWTLTLLATPHGAAFGHVDASPQGLLRDPDVFEPNPALNRARRDRTRDPSAFRNIVFVHSQTFVIVTVSLAVALSLV
jgi:hypothetical protein